MLRHWILLLHRYVGLALALFLILVGLTGSLLAFKLELERMVNPQLFAAPAPGTHPLGLADLAERAQALAAPGGRVIYFTVDVDQAAFVVFPGAGRPEDSLAYDRLFLDPVTGRELGRRREGDLTQGRVNLIPFIYHLHRELAAGPWGAWFLGVLALVWTVDCIAAIYLTLPRGSGAFWRRWRPSWLVKRGADRFRLHFDLHRAGSLWLWPILLMFAWSSVMLDLPAVYERVNGALFDTSNFAAILATTRANETPRLDWHQAEAAGARLMAELAARDHFRLGAPDGFGYLPGQGVYVYDVHSSLDVWRRGWNTGIWLDGDTGALRMFFPPTGAHLGDTISTWLRALHYGDVHDFLPYRIVDCLMGLALTLLSVTGLSIWLRKRAARRLGRRLAHTVVPLLALGLLGFGEGARAAEASPALPHDLSFAGMIAGASPVAQAVISGLALASIAAWTVWLGRTIELRSRRRAMRGILARLAQCRSFADVPGQGTTGDIARLVEAARMELTLSGEGLDRQGILDRMALAFERIEAGASQAGTAWTGLVGTIGATAPFVGLFGTVWGIMNSFIGISRAQTTTLAIVAPGIAEALLTTALGLFAAIPAVIFFNLLVRAQAADRGLVGDAAAELLRIVSRDLDRAQVGG